MTQAQSELKWMLELLKPPYTEGWQAYCEKKAEGLARKYPQEYAALPEMLKQAMLSKNRSEATTTNPLPSNLLSSS